MVEVTLFCPWCAHPGRDQFSGFDHPCLAIEVDCDPFTAPDGMRWLHRSHTNFDVSGSTQFGRIRAGAADANCPEISVDSHRFGRVGRGPLRALRFHCRDELLSKRERFRTTTLWIIACCVVPRSRVRVCSDSIEVVDAQPVVLVLIERDALCTFLVCPRIKRWPVTCEVHEWNSETT